MKRQATLFESWQTENGNNDFKMNFGQKTNKKMNLPPFQTNSKFDKGEVIALTDGQRNGRAASMDNGDDEEVFFAMAVEASKIEFELEQKRRSNNETNAPSTSKIDNKENYEGFDTDAGKIWIYPTNFPVRNYQYEIIEKSLFYNTLVTLPTGLGKTFIAAVVMYNFYRSVIFLVSSFYQWRFNFERFRWYPAGKVIFMAPTKPLVAQQIEACFNIMGIPQEDVAEMTGNTIFIHFV
jgi:hypothetical protein